MGEHIVSSGVNTDHHFYLMVKRWFDIVAASVLLVLLAPLMLLIAVLIRLDSRGTVLFVQNRAGSRPVRTPDGHTYWEIRSFPIFKFRSMYSNVDQALHKAHIEAYVSGTLTASDNERSPYKLTHDPRITRVGRILRKSSLDELPQLFNVLRGEMSLVGPRPVPMYEFERYRDQHKERLATWPGITGLWQVKGRCQISFEEQVQMDIDYVRRQSFWLDLKILLLTIPAVLSGRGAE